MNKYQEAWDFINTVSASTDRNRIMPLKELVDKETPMKPILREFINKYDCEDYEYLCGKCKAHLSYHHWSRVDRCNDNECNQLVDWSDEE